MLRRQRFDGEAGSAAEVYAAEDGGVRRVLFVGTGGGSTPSDSAEKLGGTAVAKLLTSGERHLVIDLSGASFDAEATARVALAAQLRSWRYDQYRTKLKDKHKPTVEKVTIVGGDPAAADRWAARWEAVAKGIGLTRELVTEPANIIYPESFVERVRKAVDGSGLEIEVLDGAAMAELGMGALLGVAQGSVREPRLLILRWNGGQQGAAPFAFVGKGVTFDTGGISIKPAQGMEAMKWDMGGAGAVAGGMLRAGRAQGEGERRRHLRPGREHARRQRAAPRRRRHQHVGPDDRGHQHRCRGAARPRRRDHLRAAEVSPDRRSSTSRR